MNQDDCPSSQLLRVAPETASAMGRITVVPDSAAGFDVSSTNVVWVAGSHHDAVPVDPECPNVAGPQYFPKRGSFDGRVLTAHPMPHG